MRSSKHPAHPGGEYIPVKVAETLASRGSFVSTSSLELGEEEDDGLVSSPSAQRGNRNGLLDSMASEMNALPGRDLQREHLNDDAVTAITWTKQAPVSLTRRVQVGDQPSTFSTRGYTPMHCAAYTGCSHLLPSLLKAGGKINATAGLEANTPLQLACEEGHVQMVEVLLLAGAAVDSRNADGATALHLAAQNGCRRVIELLLTHNACPDARDSDGCTAIHLSAQYAHHLTVKTLINYGASVDIQNKWGHTALHWAAMRGRDTTVQLLLSASADSILVDAAGRAPVDVAAGHRRRKVFARLIEHMVEQQSVRGIEQMHSWYTGHARRQNLSGREGTSMSDIHLSKTIMRWCKRMGLENPGKDQATKLATVTHPDAP